MAKKDYREKIEEDRQQIEVETELSRLSRSKHKAKKRRNPLISILLVTFILIPLSLLFYVKFFYVPKPVIDEAKAADEQVELETNEEAKKKQQQEDKAKEVKEQEKQQAAEEQAKKDAELATAKKAEQEAAAKKAEEQRKADEAKKAEEQKAQAEQETQQPSSKSHTVQAGDNLYRIALKYYGDASAVEKIKAANGLSSDSVPVGKTLVLP